MLLKVVDYGASTMGPLQEVANHESTSSMPVRCTIVIEARGRHENVVGEAGGCYENVVIAAWRS